MTKSNNLAWQVGNKRWKCLDSRSCLLLCIRENISLSKSAEALKPPPTGRLSFSVSCGPKQAAVMHTPCDKGEHVPQSAFHVVTDGAPLADAAPPAGGFASSSAHDAPGDNLVADMKKFRARYSTIAPRRKDCLEQLSRIIYTMSRKKRELSLWQVRW